MYFEVFWFYLGEVPQEVVPRTGTYVLPDTPKSYKKNGPERISKYQALLEQAVGEKVHY